MKKNYDNLDDLKRDLEKLADNARELNGKKVSISDLMNPDFMKKHTQFNSFDEMYKASLDEYAKKLGRNLMDK